MACEYRWWSTNTTMQAEMDTAASIQVSLPPTTVVAEKRALALADGVRIPSAEYEYDLAGSSRSRTRFKGMDGIVFDVYDTAACVSGSMAAVIRSKDPSMPLDYAYPLSNVQSGVLETVLEYCYFNASTTREIISDCEADQWDDEFASLDPRHLCELASAAYYLDIKALVDLTCKTIASMISGKSADEIRSTFHIENDLDGEFLSVFPSDWYAPGNNTRANRYRTRMLTTDRHTRKLSKQKAQHKQSCMPVENEPIANASVEEIMNYIDGDKSSSSKSSSKRRRGRKKIVQSPDTSKYISASDPKSSDDNCTELVSRNCTHAQLVDVEDSPPATPSNRAPPILAPEESEERSPIGNTHMFSSSPTSPITPTHPNHTVSLKPTATGKALSSSSPEKHTKASKRARQRARKRERKRAAAIAYAEGTERGSTEESSMSQGYQDEFNEIQQHNMDEEVEAFARRLAEQRVFQLCHVGVHNRLNN